jgi:hypothetical protein
MPKTFREFERGVRASRRMRTGTPSCFETHRSTRRLWKRLRLRGAAMVLSMRARGAAFWPNEAKRGACGRAKDQPAAARNERQRSFIVSGLLFTMSFATHTCRSH